jgi:hypothetical protein
MKIILEMVNVRSFVGSKKQDAAERKINEYITENNLEVISTSLFIKSDDEYLFTLTCE